MALTAKQRLFVAYYLGKANGNATEAARMAGYRLPHEQGRQLVRKTTIAALISAHVADAAMPANEVLARLSEIATGDLKSFLEQDEHGAWKFNLAKAKNKSSIIKKVRLSRGSTEIEIHNPLDALDKLAKYHGLLDRARSSSSLDFPPATDESGNPAEP